MKTKIIKSNYLMALALLLVTTGSWAQFQPALQYFRPYDKRGVNVYETPKTDTVVYDGMKLRIGANFTQGYQNLNNSNAATPAVPVYDQAGGFPLAMANFNIDVQLADGVRVSLVSYMSSHHHNEFWVKGGYVQFDKVGFLKSEFMNNLWKNLTLKVGHMEINYGDAHFRRSDGGNTIYNPFIENNITDAFTTEIGGELYWQKNGIITMLGVTDGEIQGNVSKANDRSPSIYGKLGFDRMFGNIRGRLTGSFYTTASSVSNTLYGGDRTGSNYQYVMEPPTASLTGNAFSGRVNPGFKDNITSFMVNPFVKIKGLEFFGTYETSSGNTQIENGEIGALPKLNNRTWNQVEGDVVYRFGQGEKYYVGAKYNKVSGDLVFNQNTSGPAFNAGTRTTVGVERTSFAAGWFITQNILFKGEYVMQKYFDYPTNNILSKGTFDGIVIQATIGF